jgi:hypothetical protein
MKQLEPRDYQIRITDKATAGWAKYTTQLIESPTASGKSAMALRVADRFIHEVAPSLGFAPQDVGIGWMAGKSNLLNQVVEENRVSRWPGSNGPMVPQDQLFPILMWDGEKVKNNPIMQKPLRFYVVDECHHDACSTAQVVANTILPQYSLGLSATPSRGDHATLLFQHRITDCGYRFLIEQGYLAEFDFYQLSAYNPASVVNAWHDKQDVFGKSVMFFLTLADCTEAVNMLRALGHRAELISGSTPYQKREEMIDDLGNGDLQVLVSMSILSEGLDVPSLKTVFVRDTHTESVCKQMAGRVLRQFKGTRKNIVQSTNSNMSFVHWADPVNRFNQVEVEGGGQAWVQMTSDLEKARELVHVTTQVKSQHVAIMKRVDSIRALQALKARREAYLKELQHGGWRPSAAEERAAMEAAQHDAGAMIIG